MLSSARLQNVQVLRAVAAVLVIAVHEPRLEARVFDSSYISWLSVPGGIGVDLFFVISGFIMVTTMWDGFGVKGAWKTFLLRRIERIYPMYWFVMTAYLILHLSAPALVGLSPATVYDVIASYLLLPHGTDPVLVVGWTLQFEMAFYLVFAFALRFSRRRLPLVLGGWALLTIFCAVLVQRVPSIALSFLGSPLIFEFLFGALVGAAIATRRIVVPLVLLVAGLAGVFAVMVYTSPLPALPSAWFRAFAIAPPMALVLAGAVGLELRRGLAGPAWLAKVGDASYSLYLSHGLVLATVGWIALRLHPRGAVAHVAFVLCMYGAAIAVSLGLYRLVERPMLRLLQRVTIARHPRAPAAFPVPPMSAPSRGPFAARPRLLEFVSGGRRRHGGPNRSGSPRP